jgi:hypothetical protein
MFKPASILFVACGLATQVAAQSPSVGAPGLKEIARPSDVGLKEVRVLAALADNARGAEAKRPSGKVEIVKRTPDPALQSLEGPKETVAPEASKTPEEQPQAGR